MDVDPATANFVNFVRFGGGLTEMTEISLTSMHFL